ncbi:MAG: hypothetical protein Q9207_007741 [Kuettlingeria erythrocarpa]
MDSMDMAMTTAIPTADMAPTMTGSMMAATSSAMSHSGMSMGGDNACKISMLWNWYTIDSCFITSDWHITSKGGFAGFCFGAFFLVILLEYLRRWQRMYDASLVREYRKRNMLGAVVPEDVRSRWFSWESFQVLLPISKTKSFAHRPDIERNSNVDDRDDVARKDNIEIRKSSTATSKESDPPAPVPAKPQRLVPSTHQQATRALMHTLQFTTAYLIMLLAMYYNGYVIICIVCGAFLGAFLLNREILVTDT